MSATLLKFSGDPPPTILGVDPFICPDPIAFDPWRTEVKSYSTCCKGGCEWEHQHPKPFWGPLGNWKYCPINKHLLFGPFTHWPIDLNLPIWFDTDVCWNPYHLTAEPESSFQAFWETIQRKVFVVRGPAVQVFSKPHSGTGPIDWLALKIEDENYQANKGGTDPETFSVWQSLTNPYRHWKMDWRPKTQGDWKPYEGHWWNRPWAERVVFKGWQRSNRWNNKAWTQHQMYRNGPRAYTWTPDFSVRLNQDNRLWVPWKHLDLDKLRTSICFLNPDRFATPLKLRPRLFEIVSQSKWRHTTEQISVGHLSTANTSSLVARSIRYFGPEEENPATFLVGKYYRTTRDNRGYFHVETVPFICFAPVAIEPGVDFHDLMQAQLRVFNEVTSIEPPVVIKANAAALETEIQEGAAQSRALYEDGIAFANVEEAQKQKDPIKFSVGGFSRKSTAIQTERMVATINWSAKPSKALTAFWDKQLDEEAKRLKGLFKKNEEMGIEHTGFEGIGNEECPGLKYRKSRPCEDEEEIDVQPDPDETLEPDPIDEDLVENDLEEINPEDDDLDEDEGAESFSDSGSETSESTCYNNDPRFDDDEEVSGRPEGCDWIERSRDGRDATRQTENPPTHEELQALRDFVVARPDPVKHSVVLEMVLKGRTAEEVAVKHEVEPKTAQKWKERTMKAAELLKDRPSGMPNIPITDEMLDVVLDGGAYVLVNLDDGWKYRPLDVENHDTLDQAIAALKESQICAAWKDSDVHKKTVKRYRSLLKGGRRIDLAQIQDYRRRERAKVADRINRCFEQIYTFPSPEKWVNRRAMLMKEKELAEANENKK